MRMRSGALAALLCVALLAGCDKPEVPATTAVSERPPAASSSPGASSDIETIMGLPVPSLDLNTKEGIREYLVGEWWYDTGCIDDFLCHMVIDEELGVSLSFINYGTDEDRGTYEGQISLDWIFVEEPKAPDLICIDLGEYETQYPGGDYCFTHQTIYEGKRVMSWYFMGNGDSVFGLLDEAGFGFPPSEIVFTKHTGEESGLKPRPNDEFYATFWGYSGFDDNAIWLDDLTQKEPDYAPLYPWEMAHFENETKESVAYTLQPGVLVGIEDYLLIRGNVYLVRTDAHGEIYYMADADYDALSGEYDDTVPEWLKEHLCTILSDVVEVREYLDMGMRLLITDEEEQINSVWCNVVKLGTDHEDSFTTEFMYAIYLDTIADYWYVYRYDVLTDAWEMIALHEGDDGYISGTGTVTINNGGHHVKYGGMTYFRQYDVACFASSGLWDDFTYIPGASSKIMQMDLDGTARYSFDDNGCGPIYIEEDEPGMPRMVLQRLSPTDDGQSSVSEIYSVKLDGTDKREHGSGSIFAIDTDRDIIIVRSHVDEICGISISTGERAVLADPYHLPRYYDNHEGVLYCHDTAGGKQSSPATLCSIQLDTGKHKEIFSASASDLLGMLHTGMLSDWYDFRSLRPSGDFMWAYLAGYSGNMHMYDGGTLLQIHKDGSAYMIGPSPAEIDWFGAQVPFSFRSDGPFYKDVGGYFMCGMEDLIEPEMVLSEADLVKAGLTNGEYYGEADFASVQNVEYVDADIFFTVVTGTRDPSEDIGWRFGYRREESLVYRKDLLTGKIKMLYCVIGN